LLPDQTLPTSRPRSVHPLLFPYLTPRARVFPPLSCDIVRAQLPVPCGCPIPRHHSPTSRPRKGVVLFPPPLFPRKLVMTRAFSSLNCGHRSLSCNRMTASPCLFLLACQKTIFPPEPPPDTQPIPSCSFYLVPWRRPRLFRRCFRIFGCSQRVS